MSRFTRGWKSGKHSVDECESLLRDVIDRVPGITVRNRSLTTSSIYCKTPDGYSLRIGDHNGKEKYKYKWNLNPALPWSKCGWKKDYIKGQGRKCYVWRYYTNSSDELAQQLIKFKIDDELFHAVNDDLWERPLREPV